MTTVSMIDNMTIEELAQYVKTASTKDKNFIYAAKQLGERFFVEKSREVLELDSELKAIYKKHPELMPFSEF